MKQCLLLLLALSLYAQTLEEIEETAQKAYLANINTLLIFTSESGLSSGKYRFTHANFKMETYALPFRYHLKEHASRLNFFIDGGVGYSVTRLDGELTVDGSGLDLTHDNKLQTYIAGVGGGLRYKSAFDVDFLGSFGLIYSRVGTSVTPKDDVGDAIERFFDGEFNDNISYKFLLAAEYHKEIKGFKPYVKTSYKYYETKADFSLNSLGGFSTNSDVTSFSVGIETPSLLKYEQDYLSLEAYVKYNYLHGDITEVVQFHHYANVGILAYWNTPKLPSWAERFHTEISTVRAEGLEGYNVGIGFTLDY